MRAQIEKTVAQKEKEKKEENLRQLAQKVREERAGIRRNDGNITLYKNTVAAVKPFRHPVTLNYFLFVLEKDEDLKARDDLRRDRMKERARDRNLARAAPDKRSVPPRSNLPFEARE